MGPTLNGLLLNRKGQMAAVFRANFRQREQKIISQHGHFTVSVSPRRPRNKRLAHSVVRYVCLQVCFGPLR
jgi:hypothetical protein